MIALSDAFIAMPGGIGTFEEFFEVYTLRLMGFHDKPFGLLNVNGFYEPLDALLNKAETEGFLKAPHQTSVIRSAHPGELIDRLMTQTMHS